MDTEKIRETAERFYNAASEPNSIGFLHDFHDFLVALKTDPSWSDQDVEQVRDLVFRMISDRTTKGRGADETIAEDQNSQRRKIRVESDG